MRGGGRRIVLRRWFVFCGGVGDSGGQKFVVVGCGNFLFLFGLEFRGGVFFLGAGWLGTTLMTVMTRHIGGMEQGTERD